MQVDSFFGKVTVPEGYLVLQCEYCQMNIGTFRPENIDNPVNASMFESMDKAHDAPHPFAYIEGRTDTLDWEHLNCPVCGVRVFVDFNTNKEKEYIRTPFGNWQIGSNSIPGPENQLAITKMNQKEIERIWTEEKLRQGEIQIEEEQKGEEKQEVVLQEVIEEKREIEESEKKQEPIVEPEPEIKTTKDHKPETNITSKKAFRKEYPGRCMWCGRDCKVSGARAMHEKACEDNPKNIKKEK